MKNLLLFVPVLVFLASCRKDEPPVLSNQTASFTTSKRLLVCDEGNYNSGNSSLTEYDPVSGNSVISAYAAANNNQSPGDVLQSVSKINGNYYLVVNNSGRIIITDKNFAKLSVINGLISPRYIQVVSNNKAYVSNLILNSNANYLQVIDLNTNSISKSIRLDGFSEQMVYSYGKVFVTNTTKNYLYVINAATDAISDSIFLNTTSSSIVKDEDEKLWVSCDAGASAGKSSLLLRIDPVTYHMDTVSLHTASNTPWRLCMNGAKNTLYFLMDDVYKLDVHTKSVSMVLSHGTKDLYGLGIDPDDETIYISDDKHFNQNGAVYAYDASGNFIRSFNTGVGPGFMLFDE